MKIAMYALAIGTLLAAAQARAADAPRPADQRAIDACLAKAGETPERCIGIVYDPCTKTPEGGSTMGMGQCSGRELAVWDAMLNTSFQALLRSSLGDADAMPENRPPENRRSAPVKGADILRDMQRAWIAFHAKKCDAAAMQFEGGSASRVIYGDCNMRETARQALWLRELAKDISDR